MLVKQLMSIINRNMIVKQVDTIQNILGTDGMIPAGCVFVCEEKKLIGILTDGDLRRQLITLSDNTTVGKMMAHSPKFVLESTLVSEAFTLMTQSAINQLPVLNDDHHIVGYLNYHTLANQLSPEQLFIDLQSSQLSENEQRHLSRYHFASQFIQPQLQVLDCACGSGYGSKILTDMGMQVTGVDLCQKAIDHAKEKYKSSNITFQCQDINHLDFADECFDAVVTLETLEHVTNEVCRQFIKKIDNMLKPGGLLIASSPMLRFKNKQPYITNPYHINELPRQELLNMFNSLLPGYVLHFYHQKDTRFVPLGSEHTGFCILVARKGDKGC